MSDAPQQNILANLPPDMQRTLGNQQWQPPPMYPAQQPYAVGLGLDSGYHPTEAEWKLSRASAEIERLKREIRRLRWMLAIALVGGTVTWLELVL